MERSGGSGQGILSEEWGKQGLRKPGVWVTAEALSRAASSAERGVLLSQVPSRSQSSVGLCTTPPPPGIVRQ